MIKKGENAGHKHFFLQVFKIRVLYQKQILNNKGINFPFNSASAIQFRFSVDSEVRVYTTGKLH